MQKEAIDALNHFNKKLHNVVIWMVKSHILIIPIVNICSALYGPFFIIIGQRTQCLSIGCFYSKLHVSLYIGTVRPHY